MPLKIAVARERTPGEQRVALVPETAKKFAALGASLCMEQSAGVESHFLDPDYAQVAAVNGIAEAYSAAGLRTGYKITTQNQVTSLTITSAWNPADTAQNLIRDDGDSGSIIRTYVIAVYDGTDTVAYAFNGRVGGMQWDMSPSAEGKFTFTIHPVGGNSYGWSNS